MKITVSRHLVAALLGCLLWNHASALGLGGLGAGSQPMNQPQVLAQGIGGNLTRDALAAYVEALEFCLAQIGSPTQFSAGDRQQITQVFTQNFASMPAETQNALATARPTWIQYRQAWAQLTMDQKKAFAYDVLSLAYGEQAAAQALGMGGGGSGGGGSTGSGYGGFSEPCYSCTEQGSLIYGGATDLGGGEFAY